MCKVTVDRFKFAKRYWNPTWHDLPEETKIACPSETVTAIEREEVIVFGMETSRFHVFLLGARQPQVWNLSGKRLK